MQYITLVLVVSFCSNFVVSISNQEQNEHTHLKEKSHELNHERAHKERHHERVHKEYHHVRTHQEHHERAHQEHHHERVKQQHHNERVHQEHHHGRVHHEQNRHLANILNPSIEVKQHHQRRSHFDHHVHYRDQQNQQCSWVCNGNQDGLLNFNIQVQYKNSSALFGILNQEFKEALIFAYNLNIIVLLNGKTGQSYILVLDKDQLFTLPNTPGVSWTANSSNFQDYFQNLSVSSLLQTAQQSGQPLDINKLPDVILKEFEDNLKSVGLPIPFDRALPFLTAFMASLKNGLSLLYLGNGAFDIHNRLKWFIKINMFIGDLLKDEGFDISNITLDTKNIFSGSSGIQCVANLFSQLARHCNMSNFIKSLVNSREKSLKLLEDLSSGSHNGLDGLMTCLVHIIKAASMEESPTEVIKAILAYNSTGSEEPTWGQVNDQLLEVMRVQSHLFPTNDGGVDMFIGFLKAANDNSLVINNIHIFDLLKIFFTPNPNDRIGTIIRVLSCFLPHRGIPAFFNFVKDVLSNASNSSLLTHLLPGVDMSNFTGNGSILENIFPRENFTQLFSGGNITSALSHIPILGQIVQQASSALGGQNIEQYIDPFHLQNIFSKGLNDFVSGFGQFFGSGNNSSKDGQSGNVFGSFEHGLGNLFGLGASSPSPAENPEEGSGSPPPTEEDASSPQPDVATVDTGSSPALNSEGNPASEQLASVASPVDSNAPNPSEVVSSSTVAPTGDAASPAPEGPAAPTGEAGENPFPGPEGPPAPAAPENNSSASISPSDASSPSPTETKVEESANSSPNPEGSGATSSVEPAAAGPTPIPSGVSENPATPIQNASDCSTTNAEALPANQRDGELIHRILKGNIGAGIFGNLEFEKRQAHRHNNARQHEHAGHHQQERHYAHQVQHQKERHHHIHHERKHTQQERQLHQDSNHHVQNRQHQHQQQREHQQHDHLQKEHN